MGKVLFALLADTHLFRGNLLQLRSASMICSHNEKQRGLCGMLYAFAKAQHRIETKTECHDLSGQGEQPFCGFRGQWKFAWVLLQEGMNRR